jgi:hypothetical protein
MANELSQPMEVVAIPVVGKIVDNGVVEFDLEALYKVDGELALEPIKR